MPTHARLADTTVKEAMQAEDAAASLARLVEKAASDGEISAEEVSQIKGAVRRVTREARDVVKAAEEANVGELLFGSYLTGKPLNRHVAGKAAELGLLTTPVIGMIGIENGLVS
jgi:hypothetical protein